MASKHASNERHKTNRRKHAGPPARRTSSSSKTSQEYGAIGHVRDEVSEYVSQGATQIRGMTRDREGTAVMVALAAGFGAGLLIGGALAASSARRPRKWTDRIMAEGIGRRMLERIESIIPEALAERIGR